MLALTSAPLTGWPRQHAAEGRHDVTSSPGEQAESRVRTSVVRGLGNLSRPPVMADVARLAGVSHQTVSRVLNEHPNVRPLTRERVLAAIRQLAYPPHAAR